MRTSIAQDGTETWEKDTNTRQQRRITLDPTTVALLADYLRRCEANSRPDGLATASRGRIVG